VLVLIIARKRNFPRGRSDLAARFPEDRARLPSGAWSPSSSSSRHPFRVFTATESAAVACIYAFLVTMLVYRDCKWSQLPHLIHPDGQDGRDGDDG